jgi:hypothetical protein
VQLYAFDILALDGDDLRKLPLHLRKTNLARLLARRADGIHLAPFEQGEIGPDLFKARHDVGGVGFKTPRQSLSGRPVTRLDQGQESEIASDEPGERRVLVTKLSISRPEEARASSPANVWVWDENGSNAPFVFVIHAPMYRPQSVINR